MKKAVIFDMDGTLWDSVDEIVESWNKTCPEMHIRREQLIGLMGKTMDCFAKELLSEYKLDEAMDIIHACERDENEYLSHVGAKLYGDIRKVFETLRDMGYEIGIVSNCQAGYIEVFLEYYHLGDLVADIECYGNTQQQKDANLKALIERNHYEKYYYLGDTQGIIMLVGKREFRSCLQLMVLECGCRCTTGRESGAVAGNNKKFIRVYV